MFLVIMTAFIIIFFSWFAKLSYESISFYWLNPRRIKKIMEKQGVHGPKPRPLLGNLLDVAALVASSASMDMPTISHDIVSRLIPHHLLWSHKYGKRYIYWHGVEPRMCLTDPNLIKELLTRYNHVTGKTWLQQQGSKHFLGSGLLMTNGDSWSHQRHIVSPAFMVDKLKSCAAQVVECTTIILKSLQNSIQRGGDEVEIGKLMTILTTDVISRFEFGRDHEKGKKIFNLLMLLRLRCAQASKHLYLPGGRFFPSKFKKEIKTLKKEVEELLMEIIESRTRCVEMGRSDSNGNDLVGILVNELHKNDSNGLLSTQLIMDECKTFLIAGHETTALLLTWTVMLLATNLEWQQKLRDEIAQVCNGATPAFDHLPKLRLLSMIINESLRLYPPATILPKMAFEDIKLSDLFIPKGLSIWIPVFAIHHDAELWGEDVNQFNPYRFASKSFSSSSFIPFGGGPRNCIGQSVAILEAKIILSMLVSKFKITISNTYRHAPMVGFTIMPKYGVPVYLTPIRN